MGISIMTAARWCDPAFARQVSDPVRQVPIVARYLDAVVP